MGVKSERRSSSQVLGKAPALGPAGQRRAGRRAFGEGGWFRAGLRAWPPPDAGGCQVTRSRALSREEWESEVLKAVEIARENGGSRETVRVSRLAKSSGKSQGRSKSRTNHFSKCLQHL